MQNTTQTPIPAFNGNPDLKTNLLKALIDRNEVNREYHLLLSKSTAKSSLTSQPIKDNNNRFAELSKYIRNTSIEAGISEELLELHERIVEDFGSYEIELLGESKAYQFNFSDNFTINFYESIELNSDLTEICEDFWGWLSKEEKDCLDAKTKAKKLFELISKSYKPKPKDPNEYNPVDYDDTWMGEEESSVFQIEPCQIGNRPNPPASKFKTMLAKLKQKLKSCYSGSI